MRGVRGKGTRREGMDQRSQVEGGLRLRLYRGASGNQPRDPILPHSSLLTAANLIAAVGTVALLITVVAG